MAISARVLKEHGERADPDVLLIYDAKPFFLMNVREIPHALKCIEFYRHGKMNSTKKHQK